ncbi:hypothetical protein TrVE_jg12363 [Triparma verrucosa]|uniref:cystathionine gamma-lyase n=2 Tax=Triparma TaxID=722752 RepID=A0A9W7C9I1_9STRA|nr:hypothetical protein TrST_g8100 [Triparma strigata]GMI09028.1 hypothetical protein TrVE_jg12363 [Triparma verrucosa]
MKRSIFRTISTTRSLAAPTAKSSSPLHLHTLLSHAGISPTAHSSGLSPSIDPSTTFERSPDLTFPLGHIYSRISNPTRSNLESVLSSLESSTFPCQTSTFSSGMAAVNSVITSNLALHGSCHLLIPDDCYHGVPYQLTTLFHKGSNVTWSKCDFTNYNEVVSKLKGKGPETIVWAETPSNPLLKITDISTLKATINKISPSSILLVDMTWSPPTITKGLEEGADIVLHSCTKYFGGHSDVLMGSITTRVNTEIGDMIRIQQGAVGGVPGAWDCWLVLRGLRSMHVRVERACENAGRLAGWLEGREEVGKVHYPGLVTHPGHEVAKRQMEMFGGMVSFEVGGREEAVKVQAGAEVVRRATSLGGTETLIEHRESIEPEGGKVSPEGLLRVSVGIEKWEDLERDFERMLDGIKKK